MKAHARQYTIRGIPLEVDRALRKRAKQRNMSINQLIIEGLTLATLGSKQVADFSEFVGRWAQDRAFDEVLEIQREIHADDWR